MKPLIKIVLLILNNFIARIFFFVQSFQNASKIYRPISIVILFDPKFKNVILDYVSIWEKTFKSQPISFQLIQFEKNSSKLYSRFLTLEQNKNTESEQYVFIWRENLIPMIRVFSLLSGFSRQQDDVLYFDTIIRRKGKPFFKPDYSPNFFSDVDYIEGACFFRLSSFVGNLPTEDIDLGTLYTYLFLFAEKLDKRIVSVKEFGFLTRLDCGINILHFENYINAKSILNPEEKIYLYDRERQRPRLYFPHLTPLVSIIIPFRDKVELIKVAVSSILEDQSYQNFEILLVSNQSKEKETFEYLEDIRKQPKIRILDFDESFNFSAINNFAAKEAKGDFLFFLNNDTKVITKSAIDEMVGYAALKNIGIVGARLLYEDNSIQHAGIIVGLTGLAEHAFKYQKNIGHVGFFGSPNWNRNYLSLTAACIMVGKEKFFQMNGFNEELVICGNDVDLGIRFFNSGFQNVYLASVEFYHFESKSRVGIPISENDYRKSILSYHSFLKNGDPHFHPKLNYTFPWLSVNLSNYKSHEKNYDRIKRLLPQYFEENQ